MHKWLAALVVLGPLLGNAASGLEGLEVTYVTGTVPGLNRGVQGSLDTTQVDTSQLKTSSPSHIIASPPTNIGKTPSSISVSFQPWLSLW